MTYDNGSANPVCAVNPSKLLISYLVGPTHIDLLGLLLRGYMGSDGVRTPI